MCLPEVSLLAWMACWTSKKKKGRQNNGLITAVDILKNKKNFSSRH